MNKDYAVKVISDYNSKYDGEFPFLKAQNMNLEGISILHNIPLTNETMLKVQPLIEAGADVTVTHFKMEGLEPKQDAIDCLRKAGIKVEVDHDKLKGEFDYGLDCCCQIPYMKNVKIKKGYIEITQTGTLFYKKVETSLPIFSVDDTKLKCLEGMYGTGEACVRALKEFVTADLANKNILVFGYGKVARGIVKYLLKENCNISVIDKNEKYLNDAKKLGVNTIEEDYLNAINSSDIVITATGVNGLISKICKESDINKDTILVNMGADDEYGSNFSNERVFASKSPINFMLKSPTTMFYIDPIFYAHSQLIEEIENGNFVPGYNKVPYHLDEEIVQKWSKHYNIDTSDIYF